MSRDDTVIVVASGPTTLDYDIKDLTDRGQVIAVNAMAQRIAYDCALTMDRLFFESSYAQLFANRKPYYVRASVLKLPVRSPYLRTFLNDVTTCRLAESIAPLRLNGDHSGLCAVNLAYQMRPRRIYLLGFDLQRAKSGDSHSHGDHAWAPGGGTKDGTYARWARDFESVHAQLRKVGIALYNVTHRSAIEHVPRLTFNEFLRCTNSE